MKHKLLLIAAFVLMVCVSAPAAHAATPHFCIFTPLGNGDFDLLYLQYSPVWGYSAWACPYPGAFAKYSSNIRMRWQSTCLQGGLVVNETYIKNLDTEIDIGSGIYDPGNGNLLGWWSSYTIVQQVGTKWLPQWLPGLMIGPVPCDPNAHVVSNQSVPQPD